MRWILSGYQRTIESLSDLVRMTDHELPLKSHIVSGSRSSIIVLEEMLLMPHGSLDAQTNRT